MEMLKVSSKTEANKLGAAIYRALKSNGKKVEVRAIGAGAVNQAVKGIIVARRLAAPEGGDLKIVPGFVDTKVEGKDDLMTAMRFIVYWR